MAKGNILTDVLIENINRVGNLAVFDWFKEKQISINGKGNLFELLESALQAGIIKVEQVKRAIAELEENSSKKICLLRAKNFKAMEKDRSTILKELRRKYGIVESSTDYQTGSPAEKPTFIYLYWKDNLLKIKYMEKQFELEIDIENNQIIKVPKCVCILYVIDTKDGFTQIRFDNAYDFHRHKNDSGKASEAAYEQYYKDFLRELFPDANFSEMDLNGVANHISKNEKKSFRLNKGVNTITNGAKQTYSSASTKNDVRDLPEYEAASAKTSSIWRTEDLTGYWLANQSEGELNRDLFMRISRKLSQIRVQRGCLEKELNYGIGQIRKIQKAI